MSDATTAVPAAIASSSTTPNDSPSSAGKQATVAPRRRACFSVVGHAAEPLDPRARRGRAALAVCGPVADRPTARRRARARRTRRAAPPVPCGGSWRPTKKIAGRGATAWPARARATATSTPLGRISQSAAERERDLALRVLRHRGARPRAAASSAAAASRNVSYQPLRPGARRVERADRGDRRCRRARRGSARATSGSCRCSTSGSNVRSASIVRRGDGAAGGDRRDRAVARHARARADGGDARARAAGRRTGPMMRASTPSGPQRAREPEHLALHAAEQRQRVRARQHDPHRHVPIVPPGSSPAAGSEPGGAVRSLGQLGCSRCHCVGCRPGSAPRSGGRGPG